MKTMLTPRVMILAASIAGLIACDASKKVEQEQQDLNQAQQEAVKDQAELNREHAKETAELQQDQNREIQRDMGRTTDTTGTAGRDTMARGDAKEIKEDSKERTEERTDLAREHAEERADLNKDTAEKMQDKKEGVIEAKKEANEQRADLVQDSREKLRELDERAAKLKQKLTSGESADDAKERNQATTALSGFPTKRQAVERDIEALNSVSEANLNRAKDKVEKQLSSLDKVLDRAESSL